VNRSGFGTGFGTGFGFARPITSFCIIFGLFFLTACSSPALRTEPGQSQTNESQSWAGRLSIQIETDPVQQTSVGFEIRGNPSAGQLELTTPLGTKAAQVNWQTEPVSFASVQSQRGRDLYPSLAVALEELTGAAIPIDALFGWLRGESQSPATVGWTIDLSRYPQGRILAMREQPLPRLRLRIALEQ
jgi:outer membrane lipoprotein LolB